MAFEIPDLMIPVDAGADLSASQYCGAVINAAGAAVLPAAGARIAGVIQNKPTLGKSATLMASGITKMVASAAIAGDANVAVTATGQAVTAASGQSIIGKVQGTPASAAGQIISVALGFGGVVA
jgi:hypothetical protein